ncbi:hypothetical protein A2765_02840 [Candidatus Kaiserbacteria bacterium RIFCSPHIGHO2_01_FULL_56_24]|uniref:Uncharacterized protein n=1 Tax=Candidatus Kaiserbacteria bacterium RIFCSPHIGHO2_01_FULL_56_24 TaxID=1798487 RepID=A0A1F6DB67_9BACT|nr:MAG: hypothetical protein A2765_02840 [Candidatus Kaiserbacteria bacterium RIFCSPHIGHO2_01_FULL_56_24]
MTTEKTLTADELAVFQISREDTQALLRRLSAKRIEIQKVFDAIEEARKKNEPEVTLSYEIPHRKDAFNTVLIALNDLHYEYKAKHNERAWGLGDPNIAYCNVVTVTVP